MNRLEFIKKIGVVGVGIPILLSFKSFSVVKQQVIYPPLDSHFETFDHELFEMVKKLDKDYEGIEPDGTDIASAILPDGTYLYIDNSSKSNGYYYMKEIPPYSYFTVAKSYDKRGYITKKGLLGVPLNWKKGKWYYFNSNRQLEKIVDYDAPFKFTFEEVEAFCLSKGMKLRRGYRSGGALIQRIYVPEASYNCWKIIYRESLMYDEYCLDLQTGEILSYRQYKYQG